MNRSTGMRLLLALLAGTALGGCRAIAEQSPGELRVRSARLETRSSPPRLDLALDCRLSGPMADALDHGVPLTFAVSTRAVGGAIQAHVRHRVELRYFPLSRRYQWRDLEGDEARSFVTPAHLLAGLGALRLNLPATFAQIGRDAQLDVDVALDAAALPGPLRLPALFEPAWRLASGSSRWPVEAH